jgi:ParB family chromosome partitioning protein
MARKAMRKALGRGLDALLPEAAKPSEGGDSSDEIRKIPINLIKPNRLQPRKNFDAERLSELAQSIKERGLIQPITVSFDAISNSYELVAGERRLRAAKLAGLEKIEVNVRATQTDRDRLVDALIENIQRDDLNAIETALGYKKLMEEFEVSQTQLSERVGKSKSAVSNTLRLLDLPKDIQDAIAFEQISEGHARALLMVRDSIERNKLFKLTVEQGLSVRKVEAIAQELADGRTLDDVVSNKKKPRTPKPIKSADIEALEKRFEKSFGTKVEIKTRKDQKSGRIVIHFYSLEDFDNISNMLKK